MDVLSGDLVIGNATIDNLLLQPRANQTVPLRGTLDLAKLVQNLTYILHSQAANIRNGTLGLKTVATSVVFDGVQVPYYTKVLSSLPLTAEVSISQLLVNTLRAISHSNSSSSSATRLNLSSLVSLAGNKARSIDMTSFVSGRTDSSLVAGLDSQSSHKKAVAKEIERCLMIACKITAKDSE